MSEQTQRGQLVSSRPPVEMTIHLDDANLYEGLPEDLANRFRALPPHTRWRNVPADMKEAWHAALRERWGEALDQSVRTTDNNIRALGGDPNSPAWDDWDIGDLAQLAALADEVRERYGAELTVKPRQRRRRKAQTKTANQVAEDKKRLKRVLTRWLNGEPLEVAAQGELLSRATVYRWIDLHPEVAAEMGFLS